MGLYTDKQRRQLVVIITVVMGLFLLWMIRDLIPAFLGAVVMYVLFRPLFAVFLVKWNFPKWLASLSILILSFLLLVLPFVVVGIMITDKVQILLEHTDAINAILYKVQDFIGYDFHDPATLNKLIQSLQGNLFGSVSSVISGVGGMLLTVGIMYFLLWFMLMNYNKFEKTLARLVPFSREESDQFADELKSSTFGNVLGQGTICLVQAILLAIGFVIFDLEDPLFWGTITFFVSFLPVVGAPIVFVPAGLIALAYGDSLAGYGIIIYGFVLVTNIDNVLRYFISRYFADTHPLITILGVIVGIPVFGLLGLVFGPLLISWFLLLTKILIKSSEKA
jgi:predicted PurR-regulated permease PerM